MLVNRLVNRMPLGSPMAARRTPENLSTMFGDLVNEDKLFAQDLAPSFGIQRGLYGLYPEMQSPRNQARN
jgi:hypothetical protein